MAFTKEFEKRLHERQNKCDEIDRLIQMHVDESRHKLNRLIYETAEEMNVSVIYIVENYVPEIVPGDPVYETKDGAVTVKMDSTIRLIRRPLRDI